MENEIKELLRKNETWVNRQVADDPDYFKRLAGDQHPEFLWIGCSDSRVPAGKIVNAEPGDLFVHRNIANQCNNHDLNILSVLQYAVESLKVRHIIVCGHYACGGVKASLEAVDHGLIDNWLRPVKQIYQDHKEEFAHLSEQEVVDKLCEWNVRKQVANIAQSTILQKAWKNNQAIAVHGMIYSLESGKLSDLSCSYTSPGQTEHIFRLK